MRAGLNVTGSSYNPPLQALKERYPEDSETCSRQPQWNYDVLTGGESSASQHEQEPECYWKGLRPEVYFKPQEVWEIRGAEWAPSLFFPRSISHVACSSSITISPVSVAAIGMVSDTRGLSLRFPRFIKVRDDKAVEDASTPEFLANMYRSQQGHGKDRGGVDDGDLVDVDVQESEAEDAYESDG